MNMRIENHLFICSEREEEFGSSSARTDEAERQHSHGGPSESDVRVSRFRAIDGSVTGLAAGRRPPVRHSGKQTNNSPTSGTRGRVFGPCPVKRIYAPLSSSILSRRSEDQRPAQGQDARDREDILADILLYRNPRPYS